MPSNKITRRTFLFGGALATTAGIFAGRKRLGSFFKNPDSIKGSIVGANAAGGHLLRDFQFPEPVSEEREKVLIIGGGVSGLSAARWLAKNGFTDFTLLELGDEVGGNAVSSTNAISSYPWGAHYLPIPNPEMHEVIDFLKESGSITGFNENGLPIYNDYHVCFSPQERLFIHGVWQKGIIPNTGTSPDDDEQVRRFLALMDEYKNAIGNDGKPAFTIPVSRCSEDENLLKLDEISMMQFLDEKKFSSKYLRWYIDYCCRDDYGTTIDKTSAYAGIFYFAARKGKGANVEEDDVLTWPEGNNFLINKLKQYVPNRRTNALVYSIDVVNDGVQTLCYDLKTSTAKRIVSDKVILATPQFINHKLLKARNAQFDVSAFTYSSWMVANITVKELPEQRGFPLCWDNVFYDSSSLGYVNACHQHLTTHEKKKVLTYYFPLTQSEPKEERLRAYERKYEGWLNLVLTDLEKVHHNIKEQIEQLDIWLWGHAMIRPTVGFITSNVRKKAVLPYGDKIFFAHSDLSGMSIFEEAFYHGIRAANEVLQTVSQPGEKTTG